MAPRALDLALIALVLGCAALLWYRPWLTQIQAHVLGAIAGILLLAGGLWRAWVASREDHRTRATPRVTRRPDPAAMAVTTLVREADAARAEAAVARESAENLGADEVAARLARYAREAK